MSKKNNVPLNVLNLTLFEIHQRVRSSTITEEELQKISQYLTEIQANIHHRHLTIKLANKR